MNGYVLDCIERRTKDGRLYYSTLVKWTSLTNQEFRAEFYTKERYTEGSNVLLDVTTRYDKNYQKEVVRVSIIPYNGK